MGLVDLKDESTPSSAFYELPTWVGINTRPKRAQFRQETMNPLSKADTGAEDNYLELEDKGRYPNTLLLPNLV